MTIEVRSDHEVNSTRAGVVGSGSGPASGAWANTSRSGSSTGAAYCANGAFLVISMCLLKFLSR